MQELNRLLDATYDTYRKGIENTDPAICANVMIGLIKVCCRLLERQLAYLEKDFIEHGGIKERMTKARLAHRKG